MSNLKSAIVLFLFLSSFSFYSCGSNDDVNPNAASISSITINDIDNNGNGSDIEISFSVNNHDVVEEVKIYLVPESSSGNFGVSEANSALNYVSVIGISQSNKVVLPENTLDISGSIIENEKAYEVFILLISNSGNDQVISGSKSISITNESLLNGVWSGNGRSSLFPNNYAVTFDLTEKDGKLTGKFYITGTTSPAFGGTDDGKFYAEIEGNSLKNVTVTQTLTNMNCPGSFTGSGTISDNKKININWTGNDCSGFHNNGIFDLNKR